MGEPRISSPDDLEAMSPNERDALVRAGIITDPAAMPAELVERARARFGPGAAERDAPTSSR